MDAVQIEGITKSYGNGRGVKDVTFSVAQGEIFGFIGPNGAGKSTTIRMMMGLSKPDRGRIALLGRPLEGDDPNVRRNIGYLPSEVSFYKEMTGKQLLEFTARAYGMALKETSAYEYAERLRFDMSPSIKSYSLGNRKKLGIIASLLHEPKLLIMDEPTSGLDPLVQQAFFELIREQNNNGTTVFFSTHVLSEVEKLCSRVAFIKEGVIRQVSEVDDIPGRRQARIEVTFEEHGDVSEKLGLRELDPNLIYAGGQISLTVSGEISAALRKISQLPIRSIEIHKPSLEELFMQYYSKEEQSR
ncbi:ABC transporter ATP-binding protein [Paenibacillus thermotolerans]|uniref:ABC transporter ATP-binding protein n=1 Tax=Paenibacillus thermotolerans TaxID=3027807 RepID=UPI00236778BD|nr:MULTISPECIES: ABC transporter ATP-binding protein [unclassified Paenibacillus]